MRSRQDVSSASSIPGMNADELLERTEEIEQQKLEKQAARRRRAAEKQAAKKRQRIERLIAPIILILTILLGLFVQFLYR